MPNYKKIEQVLDLAHRTGDKVIIVSEHHDPYVIMSVGEYEAMLHGSSPIQDMTEDQLLEKINRDIAVWKASQDDDKEAEDYDLDSFKVDTAPKAAKSESSTAKADETLGHSPATGEAAPVEEDKYYIEPVD